MFEFYPYMVLVVLLVLQLGLYQFFFLLMQLDGAKYIYYGQFPWF